MTLRKDLTTINSENNFLSLEVAHHKQEAPHSIKISSSKTLIWVEQRIYSKNFLGEKIHFRIFLMAKMTFSEEEATSHNFIKAVSEEDSAEELVIYFNKAVLAEWVEVSQ